MFLLLAYFNSTVRGFVHTRVINRWEVKLFTTYSVLSLFLYFALQFGLENVSSTPSCPSPPPLVRALTSFLRSGGG